MNSHSKDNIIVQFFRRINQNFNRDSDANKELDIKSLSQEDVESLRTTDPFMYYSIPGVRRANMHLTDVDHTNTQALCSSDRQIPPSNSSSLSPPTNKRQKMSTTVTRHTSISTEAHPDAILEEFMDELDGMSEEDPVYHQHVVRGHFLQ